MSLRPNFTVWCDGVACGGVWVQYGEGRAKTLKLAKREGWVRLRPRGEKVRDLCPHCFEQIRTDK